MRQSLFTSKASKAMLLAAAATLAFGRMGIAHAAVLNGAESNVAAENAIAFDNACADDELLEGDEVTVAGEELSLEEDGDGLFIVVDDESYSVVSFESDCETVTFQQIDGVDTLSGSDVDEDEDAEAADADEDMDEDMEEADADEDMDEDMEEADADEDMDEDMDEADAEESDEDAEESADADIEE
jgi:hypothetical protein